MESKENLENIEFKDKSQITNHKSQWKYILQNKNLKGKILVHHLKPLYEIGGCYEVDAINDLIPICPNCHLVIHSKEQAYTPQEIKNMLGNKN